MKKIWISLVLVAVLSIFGSGLAQAADKSGLCNISLDRKITCERGGGVKSDGGGGLIAYIWGSESFLQWGEKLDINLIAIEDYPGPIYVSITKSHTNIDGQVQFTSVGCHCGGNLGSIRNLSQFERRHLHTEVFDTSHNPGKYEFLITLQDQEMGIIANHRVVSFLLTTPRGGENTLPRIDYVEKIFQGDTIIYTLHGSFPVRQAMYYFVGVPFAMGSFTTEPAIESLDGRTARIVHGQGPPGSEEWSVSFLLMDINGNAYLLRNADKTSRRQ